MKFSVVTVTYNAADVIEKTITSVINQSCEDYEYVIIDGGSTDGTCDIIGRYRDNVDVFISEPDNGIYDGMNKAIGMATGEYVIFMNAGDSFAKDDVLNAVSAHIESSNPNPVVVYGDVIRTYKIGSRLIKASSLSKLKTDMAFSHQSAFVQTVFAKKKRFQTQYRYAADYAMILDLYLQKVPFEYVEIPVAIVEADSGTTYNHFLDSRKEVLKCQIANGQGVASSILYFLFVITKLYLIKWFKPIYLKFRYH